MDIKDLIHESHRIALEHGWWEEGDRNFGEVVALMHSELSEALEEYREGQPLHFVYCDEARRRNALMDYNDHCEGEHHKPEGIMVELADVFIRIADLIGRNELTDEFVKVLKWKLAYNESRPYRHGGKKA